MSERRDLESALKQEKIRKWEVFPGRNKFCCNGKIMLATQAGILYFTIFLIVATTGCFGLDAYYIWLNIHPILPILAVVQFVFVLSALCRTAFGDPGILPRATPAEAEAIEKLIAEETTLANNKGSLPYRPPPRVKDVIINGQEFKLKYCFTCKIFRPPRASHCSVCDNCVDRFDHHCPWVGNCVGRRNYKYFYLFLASLTVYCAYLLSLSVTCIVLRTNKENFLTAMQQGPLSPVVVLIAFFSIWSVAGLAGFHSLLTARNMTTNEDTGPSDPKRKRAEKSFYLNDSDMQDEICGSSEDENLLAGSSYSSDERPETQDGQSHSFVDATPHLVPSEWSTDSHQKTIPLQRWRQLFSNPGDSLNDYINNLMDNNLCKL